MTVKHSGPIPLQYIPINQIQNQYNNIPEEKANKNMKPFFISLKSKSNLIKTGAASSNLISSLAY